jgi:DNA repair protein RAD5
MDPWWNSAKERQAQDRVNRIGQKKPVSVYKFILKGSVEERIALIQAKKESMIQAAMGDVTLLPPERLTFANISIMLKPIVRK